MSARQWLGAFLVGVAIAIVIVGQIAVRLGNIDASETRLLINYWWLWLSAFISAALGIWLTEERR